MNTKLILIHVFLIISIISCNLDKNYSRFDFKNLIDYKYTPINNKSTAVCFSDLGNWQGYCLPDSNIVGVIGPYLLDEQQWAGQYLGRISLESNRSSDFFSGTKIEASSFPGLFSLKASKNGISVEIKSFFISENTFLNVFDIRNSGDKPFAFTPKIEGILFKPLSVKKKGVIETQNGKIMLSMQNDFKFESTNDTIFSYNGILKNLKPGENYAITYAVSYHPLDKAMAESIGVVLNADSLLIANEKRWNKYLDQLIRSDIPEYSYIPVKCLQTLITNWKSPIGDLKHAGLVPSMSVSYFYGFWAWDSWKHAVALANFEPTIAKNQIRAMFDFQDSSGMVPDCIFPDEKENNWRDSKPPLAAWAVWNVYQKTEDKSFLIEMLPLLEKYHQWWYIYRDNNQNGLCEYGSTDGTLIAAKWESGMDNAVRFDSSRIIQNSNISWSLNQESVDLNAYLFAEKIFLKKINAEIGNASKANLYFEELKKLKLGILELFYNQNTGYFYDRMLDGSLFDTPGPEGLIPIWSGVASEFQTIQIWNYINDTLIFNTFLPFPTIAANHPEFNINGYWRGPVWLDQAYFAINGFRSMGYGDIADTLTAKIFNRIDGLSGDSPIFENYDPHTGKGLNAPNFSWSAAHLLMMYLEYKK